MNKNIANGLIFFLILFFWIYSSFSFGATMTDYCQVPPFIGTGGEPNILMVNDVSGSMSWSAYGTSDSSAAPPDGSYDPSKGYEGYFDPAKYYKPVDPSSCSIADTSTCTACDPSISNCLYIETTPTGDACVQTCIDHSCVKKKSSCAMGNLYGGGNGMFGCDTRSTRPFGCCIEISSSGDCGLNTGNYLNYHNMRRIDILRWALTGGRPATCDGSFSGDKCDPELWDQSGSTASGKIGTVCNDSLDVDGDGVADGGCILKADNGTEVVTNWSRVRDGLTTQFKNLLVKPRLGVMTYDSSGINANKVFLGDFLASNVNSADFPYTNLITNVNSQNPGGGTPTGPAMWDALNYYAMNDPQYGGFPAQSGSGDRWKNPLYVCDGGGGNNCVLNTCARNYVLLMSDGDWNYPSNDIGSNPRCSTSTSSQSSDPVVPAYCMHKGFTNAMGTASDTTDDVATKVNGVYTIGLFMGSSSCGLKAMENTAMYGSFENSVKTWPDSLTGFPGTSTCSCTDGSSSGSLCAALPASSPDWDLNGDGLPDTFFSADDALNIKQDIMNAVQDILTHATSGTAASVLASGEGSGANLVQATYYPRRRFYDTSINWTGGLQNLWYYIDPTFNYSSIREDDGDRILNLQTDATHKDYTTQFYFDTGEQKAKARLYNSLSTGVTGSLVATIDFEELGNLWEAGKLLWNRNADDRVVYSPLDTSQPLTSNANKFSASPGTPDNTSVLRPLLNTDNAAATTAINNTLAANIVNYVRGKDLSNYVYTAGGTTVTEIYRPRTVKIDLNNNGNATDTSVVVSGVTMNETVAKVWKLGDIINSTPRIASWAPLGDYVNKYNDATYLSFLSSPTYTTRGMVYVGANDGMLHAFKLGTLQYKWSGQDTTREIAKLSGSDLGKEMWAFIPKNVLPYLKYLKETDYCHIHTVDLTPYLVDASINMPSSCSSGDYWKCTKDVTSWRTILIGGMKLGGACRDTASTCTDCVKTPVSGNGYSAYFAIDVTDENNPKFLWEFSSADLGFSTSGPAVIRISSRTAGSTTSASDGGSTNGRWFVVFGSGPTGPIDSASQKFQGRSDQNLKLFVLDLKTGSLVRTIDTGVQYAFAGSMLGSTFDNNFDYQDDTVYIPYVKRTGSSSHYTWTDGGVLRLVTNQDLNDNNVSATGGTALNPDNWQVSTVMDGIGPVTSSVTHLHNKTTGELWLFFGTGRYYFRSSAGTDDASSQRNLFGVVEPCFNNNAYMSGCVDSRSLTDLGSVDLTTTTGSTNSLGWYINLEGQGTRTFDENGNGTTADDVARSYNSERVITDPAAQTSGVVYFTTYEPYNDLCAIGGKTFIWAVKYDTGGSASSLVSGTALIQVSTGSIEQIKLSTAFNDKGNRRSGAIEGVPPTQQGLSLMQAPPPVQKVLHKRER